MRERERERETDSVGALRVHVAVVRARVALEHVKAFSPRVALESEESSFQVSEKPLSHNSGFCNPLGFDRQKAGNLIPASRTREVPFLLQ